MKSTTFLVFFIFLVLNITKAQAENKSLKLDQLGKLNVENINQVEPAKKTPEQKKSEISVSMTCKTQSGQVIKQGDAQFENCIKQKSSNFNAGNNDSNQKSLNFSFGN